MNSATTMDDVKKIPQPLGPRIRVARESAGLSVDETATRLGVSPETLEAWESDSETPRSNRLFTLAGILNVSLSWFLEGRDDQPGSPPDQAALRAQLEEIRGRLDDVLRLVDDMEQRIGDRN
ncbi:MAG: helix-turn-helix domain-containing protein [Gammaproteobacteria bacterium]|nr:helix-turn-helix domain-containing protein [Gammaproteobacteria bacterium]